MTTLGSRDPRRFGATPAERTQMGLGDAHDLAAGNGPQNRQRWLAPSWGARWQDYGSGERAVGEADYPDLSRIRGLAGVTAGAAIALGAPAALILTVDNPPAEAEMFTCAAYAQGAGYCVVRVSVYPDGNVQVGACLNDPTIVSFAANSWVTLAGIAWERAG